MDIYGDILIFNRKYNNLDKNNKIFYLTRRY